MARGRAPGAPGSESGGGTLYVVATPIGNLGDVTIRALETLRAVPLIAAEDTRIARRLLARYEIDTRLLSYHARSGPARAAELLAHLRAGGRVGSGGRDSRTDPRCVGGPRRGRREWPRRRPLELRGVPPARRSRTARAADADCHG